MNDITERIDLFLGEGWGAYGQKREQERNNKEWTEMFNKYEKNKKATAALKDLRQKNWKAEYAEKELIKKGLALTEANRPERSERDPLIWVWEDPKGKSPLAHMFLQDSASLHKYDPDLVWGAKGFYEGKLIEVKAGWSTARGGKLWIQISEHSKYKK